MPYSGTPQEIRAKKRAYREAHREAITAYNHARYLANLSENQAYARLYYANHKKERIAYSRAYQPRFQCSS